MLWNFPFIEYGFTLDEWEDMEGSDKRNIKLYVLNGYDTDQMMLFGEWETAYQPRKVEKKFRLDKRPKVKICLADFRLP